MDRKAKERVVYPTILALMVGFFIYLLYALCWNVYPLDWSDNVKGSFMALEIMLPGLAFIITAIESARKD